MTRTLADMTPDERADCVGMWAEWHYDDGPPQLVVIDEVNITREFAVCVIPGVRYVEIPRHRLRSIAPRFDLPRAWTPTGEPVPMSVEMGEGWDDETNSPAHWPVPIADCCDCERPDMRPTHHRFVTDWEVAP